MLQYIYFINPFILLVAVFKVSHFKWLSLHQSYLYFSSTSSHSSLSCVPSSPLELKWPQTEKLAVLHRQDVVLPFWWFWALLGYLEFLQSRMLNWSFSTYFVYSTHFKVFWFSSFTVLSQEIQEENGSPYVWAKENQACQVFEKTTPQIRDFKILLFEPKQTLEILCLIRRSTATVHH